MVIPPTPTSTRKLCREVLKIRKEELLALVADSDSYYRPYIQVRTKKDGATKTRQIEPSIDYLKTVQRRIDRNVLKPVIEELDHEIMGGRKGYSVIMNASHHAGAKALMKYDVKSFFPSIKYKDVYQIFRYRLNYCEEAANILTHLCVYPKDDPHVPQGAPTSTSIAILSLEKMCVKLKKYCDENDLKFSIWVDDITVSGDANTLNKSRKHINYLVNSTPFTIHPDKNTGIIKKGSRAGFSITGITIDHYRRLTTGNTNYQLLKKRVTRAKVHSDSLVGKLQFLKQVNKKQGGKLYHDYRKKTHKSK